MQKNNNHHRVALYLHLPYKNDVEGCPDLDCQRENMERLCRQKNRLITEIYHDDSLFNRSGLQKLLHNAQSGEFDTVMVYSISYLHPEIDGFLATMHLFKTAGINFVAYRENIDTASIWGKLVLNILAILAEIYVDNLAEDAGQPQPVENTPLSKQEKTDAVQNR